MSDWIQIIINVILAIITIISVYYAKRTVQVAKQQLKLSANPVIGIEVKDIGIGEVFEKKYKRRNMWVELEIANIGNDPAIQILVDGEIELQYANIDGETIIPSRFPPNQKSFLMSGDKYSDTDIHLNFGNIFIKNFFESHRIMVDLNKRRIKNAPWEDPYQTAKLNVYAYYSNNIGQYFRSEYSIFIDLERNIPRNNESAKIQKIYIQRPTFLSKIIEKEQMNKEIEERNQKRELCGW